MHSPFAWFNRRILIGATLVLLALALVVAVADMAKHGVKTIYVQTANDSSSSGIVHPKALSTFITQAHARHRYVVA